ncbi:lys-63-specific deubiquitinase brcc36-like [Stylonychia lemnae]|uniref:Lys-63-specific deubiquitinase brcc36-like n=1 Tax=Stylonychia lemnae TaxID=5949 RepID=A0A078AH77_STYLE|nr:lys-63-specific deubiquitinase brcc36-like [Stylonychia lemnae]|eukprot:CDW81186.1 lys-63-specific deubiquitinase brcc36-like [Stylonychia lemnae]
MRSQNPNEFAPSQYQSFALQQPRQMNRPHQHQHSQHSIQQQQQYIHQSIISEVIITSDVLRSCLFHSYLTQSEEVAGLLLGFKEFDQNGRQTVYCFASIAQQRMIKEKDRVEIDAIQMYEASIEAEALSKENDFSAKVVGWYHSHPNITVFPSQVDINTQFNSQLGGNDSFIGLIFSVFITNNQNNISKTEIIAFQSYEDPNDPGIKKACTIPVKILDHNDFILLYGQVKKHDFFYNVQHIQKILLQEQDQDYKLAQKNLQDKNLQKLTNASSNIGGYCKILENLSNPTDITLSSQHGTRNHKKKNIVRVDQKSHYTWRSSDTG